MTVHVLHDCYVQAEVIGADINVMPDVPIELFHDSWVVTMLNMLHQRNITVEVLRYPCWIIQYSKWRRDSGVCMHLSSFLIASILCKDASISFSGVIKFDILMIYLANPAIVNTEILDGIWSG